MPARTGQLREERGSAGPWAPSRHGQQTCPLCSLQKPMSLSYHLRNDLSPSTHLDPSSSPPSSAPRPFSQSKRGENTSQGLSSQFSPSLGDGRGGGRRGRCPRRQLRGRGYWPGPLLHSTRHTPASPKPPHPGTGLEAQTQAHVWAGLGEGASCSVSNQLKHFKHRRVKSQRN